MNKKQILLINDRIRKDFPGINCYTHVSILRDCIDNTSVILYDVDHCVLCIKEKNSHLYFYIDQKGEVLNEILNFQPLKFFGYDSVRRLAEVDLIKK